jgi:hypothetical protein
MLITLFFYVPKLLLKFPQIMGDIFIGMEYTLTPIEEGRLRIIITQDNTEVGSLYYEKAKKTFQRKPIGMNAWACVDAKVEGLYEAQENITPTEVMNKCQELIRGAGY